MVVQWPALSPHRKRVLGSDPPAAWWLCAVGVFPEYSGFLPQGDNVTDNGWMMPTCRKSEFLLRQVCLQHDEQLLKRSFPEWSLG